MRCFICKKQFFNKKNQIPRSHLHVEKCLKIVNDLWDIIYDYEHERIEMNEEHYNECKELHKKYMEFREYKHK